MGGVFHGSACVVSAKDGMVVVSNTDIMEIIISKLVFMVFIIISALTYENRPVFHVRAARGADRVGH